MRSPQLTVIASTALLAAAACERVTYYSLSPASEAPSSPIADAQSQLLASTATCAAALGVDLADAASALASATDALAKDPTEERQNAARDAWRSMAAVWETMAPLDMGPAAALGKPGGQGLAEQVDAWPNTGRCVIDQELVAEAYNDPGFAQSTLTTAKGLTALEYLLFSDGSENACAPSATINTSGAWAALSPTELGARRARYAAVVATDLTAQASAIASGWAGDFGAALAAGSAPFDGKAAVVRAVSDGLLHLDDLVRDRKLGQPLGLTGCADASCPGDVQAPHARYGVALLRANLAGVRRVLDGCGGDTVGAGTLLDALGAESLTTKLRAELTAAEAAAEALGSDDLASLIEGERPGVLALHAKLGALSTTLETEWTTVLGVTIPSTVQGDND